MQELISIKNDEAVTTSLLVAEFFGKRHADVLRRIEQLIKDDSTQNCVKCFRRGNYLDSSRKNNPMYYMNRDGFTFLSMSFTGKKANEWKWKYIELFNQMEEYIRFRKSDIQIQKNSMKFLSDNLQMPCPKDFMKANTIANKCVSTLNGYQKMIKKAEMSAEMLEQREPILKNVVELMAVKDKYNLDISVADNIYKKYGG